MQAQGFFAGKPKARAATPPQLVYFGTDTEKPGAQGIYAARFDSVAGRFTQMPTAVAPSLRPSFLAVSQRAGGRRLLHVANEGNAHTSAVSTYSIDAATGALKLLGQVPAAGAGPCYLAVHPDGGSAFIANYMGGSVTSFRVLADGTLSQPVQNVDFRHSHDFGKDGPNADRQDGSHPHSAMLSPDGRYLIVCDLGRDDIVTFPVDGTTGKMGTPHLSDTRAAGSGPRHVAFHPNGRWVYGIDELTSKIDQYLWNTVHGASGIGTQALLTDMAHTVSTLDGGFKGANTAAEIAVSPEGRFVYASNRGEDSLAVFAVGDAGALSPLQRIGCGGKTPRHFTLDPTGRWLLCGNQESGTVAVFARDAASGKLSGPVQVVPVPAVQFTLFV